MGKATAFQARPRPHTPARSRDAELEAEQTAAPANPRCDTCGFPIDAFEGGRCDRCRMKARGDNVLVAHDDRGWQHPTEPDVWIRCACGGEGCDPVNPALLAEQSEPLEGGTGMAQHDPAPAPIDDDRDSGVLDREGAIALLAEHMTYPDLFDELRRHFELDVDEIYAARGYDVVTEAVPS